MFARSARIIEPHIRRVRGRLTLMPVQPANAVCSGHRHASQVHEYHSRRAFRYSAHALGGLGSRMVSARSNRSGSPGFGALSGGERMERPRGFATAGTGITPWLHRAATCARASHQVSARFRPQPMPDSSVCARCIRCRTSSADCAGCSRSFRSPKPVETGKKLVAPKKFKNFRKKNKKTRRCAPRAARTVVTLPGLADRARPGVSNLVARLRPTRTSNRPRCFARARLAQ